MEPLKRIPTRRNWVAWLEQQRKEKELTQFEKYKQLCVDVATDVGERYHMDIAEVMISDESVHIYFRKGSKLYINIIPRALIIRTCKLTPHVERAVRLQLFRQKKAKMRSYDNKAQTQ
jgi:hypothetical protein